jgi:predicted amidohydrolase YtcJ
MGGGYGGNLLLTGCKIYTGVEEPRSARGLAVEGGVIVRVGSELEARQAAPRDATVLSLPGGWAFPGLNDAHIHLAQLPYDLELTNIESVGELLSRLEHVASHTDRQWIVGRGWDQEKLREGRPPRRDELDRVCPDRPVLLYRVCGHVGVANSRALEHLDPSGLDPQLVDVESGLLREEALRRLAKGIPAPPRDELVAQLEANCRRAAESGLTMVQVILSTHWRSELDAFKELAEGSRLKLRAALWFPAEDAPAAREALSGDHHGMLRFGGAKIFLDGSLGARTAALFEEYTDQPGWSGILNLDDEGLMRTLEGLIARGIRPAMHAIGDRAVEQALRVIGRLSPSLRRPRLEHASLTSPAQIHRMRELDVCPVVQPHFAVSDRWAPSRLGPRIQHLYRFKDMIEAGLRPAGSSDAPVEPLQPLTGIWAAVTNPISTPLSPAEALELYTGGSAWAAMEEARLGRLKEGMLGDIVVFADNILAVDPSRIRELEILTTVVNGEIAARPQWLSF